MESTVTALINEHRDFQSRGGGFQLTKKYVRVDGPDSEDFLNRISTQNIKLLSPSQGAAAALLEPDGKIISYFDLYRFEKYFLLAVDPELFGPAMENLEKLHFAEDLQIKDVTSEFSCLSVQGPGARADLTEAFGSVPESEHAFVETAEGVIAKEPDFQPGIDGYHVFLKNPESAKSIQKIPRFSMELWRFLRAEAGHFVFGVDVSAKNLVLESALADSVSRNKGCYPGQEVVERVFTYGNVAKKLVGLEITDARAGVAANAGPSTAAALGQLLLPGKLVEGVEEAGVLTSVHQIPWSGKIVGFGLVRKPHYETGRTLTMPGVANVAARVVELPGTFEIHRELKKI